jgi:hypothetical protein
MHADVTGWRGDYATLPPTSAEPVGPVTDRTSPRPCLRAAARQYLNVVVTESNRPFIREQHLTSLVNIGRTYRRPAAPRRRGALHAPTAPALRRGRHLRPPSHPPSHPSHGHRCAGSHADCTRADRLVVRLRDRVRLGARSGAARLRLLTRGCRVESAQGTALRPGCARHGMSHVARHALASRCGQTGTK